ncbi:hybrid sensor histidine kinase/response regulator transcription factor [Pedobacter sp. UBA5917]|jgi:signal transduction histidine kinase/ligand-binding sensor domain-containing protein/DNA-binding response OmpR family regulator|uniref:hybrid sensor histidine kinase/response regulator transcription factor n=1 Tax=Pedobacter sp. UBA5917 TaxID=1947061 RepID=UPI0025FCAB71|nr:hybrid sensor histidine kinase/response regulator transcription factor [Pedobacter sp. UBA5917]
MAQLPLVEKPIGVDQGLSNSSVNAIYQDRSGFIWMGTHDGLNRYDGHAFKIYRHQFNQPNSIDGNWIVCINGDTEGRIWIGTSSGLNIFDPISDSFKHLSFDDNGIVKRLQSNIADIKVDHYGNVFIGTTNYGLLRYNKGELIGHRIPLITGKSIKQYNFSISAIGLNNKGVWTTVRNVGLLTYDYKKNALYQLNKNVVNNNALALDQQGKLWLGNDDGLYCYINNQLKQVYTSRNRIVSLSVKDSTLWISSDGDGVLSKKTADLKPPKEYIFDIKPENLSKSIFSIFHDKGNRMWVGTLRKGGIMVEPAATGIRNFKQSGLANALVNKEILSLSEDKNNNLWVGTDGYGLCSFNLKTHQIKNYTTRTTPAISSNYVTSILTTADDKVWLTTWGGGVLHYNPSKNTFEHYSCINSRTGKEDRNTWQLFLDKKNTLWISTCLEGAVYIFDADKKRMICFDPKLVNILSFFEDESGQLWAGTYDALIKIDRINKAHRYFYTGFAVRDIRSNGQQKLWIATEGAGLQLFDMQKHSFTRYTETEGLANNAVINIIEDKQSNLWISTLGGISIYNPTKRTFKTVNTETGLLSNELSYHAAIKLKSGEMAFGSIKGLNVIDPESFKSYKKQRNIYLTGISINNLPIAKQLQYVTEKTADKILAIKIPYNEATVALSFISPKYIGQAEWSYAYYLQGWDKTWSIKSNNTNTVYNRLSEGTYYFKVRLDEQGNIADNTTTLLTIVVLPPFYRTWWAYLSYLACASGLIYVFIQYRSRQIRMAYEVDFAKLQVKQEKDLNEKKLTFFTNISHEFRTPLTLIINPIKELLVNFDRLDVKTELNTMLRNSKRLLNLIDQLLGFRKLENESQKLKIYPVDIHALCEEVYKCFESAASSKKINYHFISPDPNIILYVDYEKIEICVFNLLSNAFKYTPANGEISLELVEFETEVAIKVIDSGAGISNEKDNAEKIFDKYFQAENKFTGSGFGIGLYLVKELVSAHQGRVSYLREDNRQTIFTLTFKKGLAHIETGTLIDTPPVKHGLSGLMFDDPEVEEKEYSNIKEFELTAASFVTDKKTVLVVDDDKEIRNYLKRLLQEKYTVKEAEDGAIGLQMIKEFVPDLVISDIFMKNMNGVALCQQVKSDAALEHIPVILLTATTSADSELTGIECGADDYITKPFENKLLMARVENILKNRSKLQKYFLDTITLNNPGKVSADFSSFLDQCINFVEKHINDSELSINTLAYETGLSHSGLYRKIKRISGLSINAFIRHIRLRRAAVVLLTSDANINEVAFQVGINDIKHFRTQFKKVFGLNPSAYVKKYKGSLNPNQQSLTNN